MPWKLEFHPAAVKELEKLGKKPASRILKTLETRIAVLEDPRSLGSALRGDHQGYWRWRIGPYRVIARIDDRTISILVVRVAHRREAYR